CRILALAATLARWVPSLRPGHGQADMEDRAFPLLTLYPNGSSVGINHILHNLGSQPRPSGFPTDNLVCEQTIADLRRHASTCVRDHEVEDPPLRIALPAKGDRPA